MPGSITEARKRQMGRLHGTKSHAYQDAADASAARRT